MTQSAYHRLSEQAAAQIRKAFAEWDIKEFIQKADNTENGTFRVVASKQTPDRSGDEIPLDGWNLKNFKNNPVLLWAHNYSEMPIGAVTKIAVEGKELVAEGYFAPAEANPFAQQVRRLYDAKLVNAVSVGFMPLEYDKDFRVLKQELVELSFVPVPMHPDALRKEGFSEKDILGLQAMLKTADTEQNTEQETDESEPEAEAVSEDATEESTDTETGDESETADAEQENTDETETEKSANLTVAQLDAVLDAKLAPLYEELKALKGKSHPAMDGVGDTKGRDLPTDGSVDIKSIVRTAQDIDKAAEFLIKAAKAALGKSAK